MNRLALLFILAACAALSSCDPCGRLARRCPPAESVYDTVYRHDTLLREVRWVDTLLAVQLVREEVNVYTPLEDTARAETEYALAMSWAEGERLRLLLTNKDSAEVLVKRVEVLERQVSEERSRSVRTVVRTEYRTRGIVKAAAWYGLACAVVTLLRIVIRLARR